MIEVHEKRAVAVDGAALWNVVGDFYSLDWLPAVTSTRAAPEERTRFAVLPDGGEVVEVLVEERDRLHRYVVTGGPMPVKDFEATLTVTDLDEKSCEVEWSARFEGNGIPDDEAAEIVSMVFRGGLHNLAGQDRSRTAVPPSR